MPPRRWVVVLAVLGLVLAGGGTAAIISARQGSAASPVSQKATGATATVTRGDLLQTQQLTGAVGYGSPQQITGQAGIITWLPSAGLTVKRGEQLFRVDDQPVSLLYGGLPLYRTLTPDPGAADQPETATTAPGTATDAPGAGTDALAAITQAPRTQLGPASSSGSASGPASPSAKSSTPAPPSASPTATGSAPPEAPAPPSSSPTASPPPQPLLSGHDVDLVATNLAALGFYHGPTTGIHYGPDLTRAVKHWQSSIGAQATGILAPGSVVVSGGPVRVDGVTAQVGADASGPVLTVTSTTKVITLQAVASVAQALKPGTAVTVTLGNGTTIAGRVQAIGAATPSANGGSASAPVTVKPRQPTALADASLGPVTAELVTASAKDVLYVPVSALLALSGGGYALELADKSLVPVTIGTFANGEVEVNGVPAGTKVMVAQ